MVPRGGIEPSPIELKIHHFLNSDLQVYLPVDPALSSQPAGCDFVPPYPRIARVTRYPKKMINAVWCALALQLSFCFEVCTLSDRLVSSAP